MKVFGSFFMGSRGVSVGRLKVSEDVWRCLLVSLVSGVVFGCFVSSKAGANPPFWPNSERQDFFT